MLPEAAWALHLHLPAADVWWRKAVRLDETRLDSRRPAPPTWDQAALAAGGAGRVRPEREGALRALRRLLHLLLIVLIQIAIVIGS